MEPQNATVSTAWRTNPLLAALPAEEQVIWWRLGLYLVERRVRDGHFLPDAILAIEVARGDPASLERALESMARLGLVREHPDGGYVMDPFGLALDRRPSDAPERVRERVRAHRARKRAELERDRNPSGADVPTAR